MTSTVDPVLLHCHSERSEESPYFALCCCSFFSSYTVIGNCDLDSKVENFWDTTLGEDEKTTVTSSGIRSTLSGLRALEDIAVLANIRDEKAHAVSFYFDLSSFSDMSHREVALTVKHLVNQTTSDFHLEIHTGLSTDLERILKMEGEIRETPAQLRAVFARGSEHIWRNSICLYVRVWALSQSPGEGC